MKPLPTWRQMNADTTPEMEALQLKLLRQAPAWHKLEMLAGLNKMAFDMSYLGFRRRYPDASEAEVYQRVAEAFLRDKDSHRDHFQG